MICIHCGADNPDRAIFCTNCGRRLEKAVSRLAPDTVLPGAPLLQLPPEQQWPQSSPILQQPQTPPGQPQPQPGMPQLSPWQQGPQPGVPQLGPGQSWPQPYPGQPQPGPFRPPPGQSWPQAKTFADVPQVKRGPNVGLILGGLLLLVVLIGSGLFFLVRSQFSKSQLCVTAQQALFCDDFADNSKGWNTAGDAQHTYTIQNDTLIVEATAEKGGASIKVPTRQLFGDFMLKVTYTLLDANTQVVGVVVRSDNNLASGYDFSISGNSYAIIKRQAAQGTLALTILGGLGSRQVPSLKPAGQQNIMTVIAKGSRLALLMNGAVVATVNDGDYTTGSIGLEVHKGKVAFSSVAIYPAPDKLPG